MTEHNAQQQEANEQAAYRKHVIDFSSLVIGEITSIPIVAGVNELNYQYAYKQASGRLSA